LPLTYLISEQALLFAVHSGAQSFAETSSKGKETTDSRLNSDEGGITSSDNDNRTLSTAKALRQRKTVEVVDADLISYLPLQEHLPSGDCPGPGQSEVTDGVQLSAEVEIEEPLNVVVQRSQPDVKELRQRLKTQRNCDEEQQRSSSPDRDTVETRLDQLARSDLSTLCFRKQSAPTLSNLKICLQLERV